LIPTGYVALLTEAPVASLVADMEKLEEEFSIKVKAKDYDALIELKEKQWQLILSEDFLKSYQKYFRVYLNFDALKVFIELGSSYLFKNHGLLSPICNINKR